MMSEEEAVEIGSFVVFLETIWTQIEKCIPGVYSFKREDLKKKLNQDERYHDFIMQIPIIENLLKTNSISVENVDVLYVHYSRENGYIVQRREKKSILELLKLNYNEGAEDDISIRRITIPIYKLMDRYEINKGQKAVSKDLGITPLEDNKMVNNQQSTTVLIEQLEDLFVQNIYNFVLTYPNFLNEECDSKLTFPDHVKRVIKKRDRMVCQICNNGIVLDEREIEVDHIYPARLGGSNNEINGMVLCKRHNKDKSSSIDFYKSATGKAKILTNIIEFVKGIDWIENFEKKVQEEGMKPRKP